MIDALVVGIPDVFGKEANHAVEVGTHGRARTDLCIFVNDQLIAIEAKFSNHRRAIGQAFLNRYYADLSYIAVLQEHLTPRLSSQAQQWRLGVLSISDQGVAVAIPAPIAFPDGSFRARIIDAAFS